jgi:hypothetical protein
MNRYHRHHHNGQQWGYIYTAVLAAITESSVTNWLDEREQLFIAALPRPMHVYQYDVKVKGCITSCYCHDCIVVSVVVTILVVISVVVIISAVTIALIVL